MVTLVITCFRSKQDYFKISVTESLIKTYSPLKGDMKKTASIYLINPVGIDNNYMLITNVNQCAENMT